jgi:hypothetical protein
LQGLESAGNGNGLKLSVVPPMAEQQQRARTDEERHYYALNAKAWRILAPF